ncbi:MAG: glycerophosphodiester phosphodiesterase [Anaerolineae bacterium]|nr:glycerophosphodiester phosphodiesterase [Anaerolineae bacterium]
MTGKKYASVLVLLLVIGVWAGPGQAAAGPAARSGPDDVLVIGHRGAAGLAPENTLAAIQVALDLGVDAVEFDIRRAADGELVVIHDAAISRTTDGEGEVSDLTTAELQQFDAGSWFDAAFAGERIPTLREVFDLTAESDCLLFIEIKDPADYPGIEADLVDLIDAYDLAERVRVLSFDHASLQRVRDLAPDLPLAGLWATSVPRIDRTGFEIVDAHAALFVTTPGLIERVHDRGQLAMAWTVDDEAVMRYLISMAIDGITTNRPDLLLAVLGRDVPLLEDSEAS